MLFTGAAISSGRVTAEDGGVVDHFNSGFGYTADDELALDTSNDPESFVKGIGVRSTGEVCATTSTAGTDTFIEGVRVSEDGKLVIEDAASQGTASGNPVRSNGALAVLL